MKILSNSGNLVDVTLDRDVFFINGEPGRISQVDVELDQIEIQLGEIVVVLNSFQFQFLEGLYPNTPTILEKAAMWKAAMWKTEQDKEEELALIMKARQIIVSDIAFVCSFPQHIGSESETRKLIVTERLAVSGQYVMVPICNECWGDLCWRVTMIAGN